MLQKILNIGFAKANDVHLNRKIRISNLISFITIVIMAGYIPVAIKFGVIGILILNVLMMLSALLSFYLNTNKRYHLSFYLASGYGLVYFILGTMIYGLSSNLHFFLLIMCLIAISLFKSNMALRIYIATAVISFFVLVLTLSDGSSLYKIPAEYATIQKAISYLNLFLLFLITILFFVFFRRENLLFQSEIIKQKEIVEQKQKEIIDSIQYSKRIQQSLLPKEKYIEKVLKNRKK